MKKRPLLFLVLFGLSAHAQTKLSTPAGQALFVEGYNRISGNGTAYDPAKALSLFHQSASIGNARALNALGNIYTSGNEAVAANADSAIAYYKTAAAKGYSAAYYNLGRLYQTGNTVAQDFVKAAQYYQTGAVAGDNSCKNELAYFYYKGLGVTQSYGNAFALYSRLAKAGNRNAEYFTGICYRNGYGVAADKDLAKMWLQLAATNGEDQAEHELTGEPLPENAYLYSPGLQSKVKQLQSYKEQFIASGNNDMSGTYKGYAVYYDFSRQYASEIVPLTLEIQKSNGRYEGTWVEGDNLTAAIKANFENNGLTFDSSCRYTRHNHYSDRNAEDYLFNQAALSVKYINDSMYLSGDVQFYSLTRKEPGQPVYIALGKAYSNADNEQGTSGLTLSPNPAHSIINVGFTLKKTTLVQMQIVDMKGTVVKRTASETLPAGSYSYNLTIQSFAAGSYVLKLNKGAKSESKIFVKL